MMHVLHWLLCLLGICRHSPMITAEFDDGTIVKGDIKMLRISTSQQVRLTAQPVDGRGNPTEADVTDLVPQWVSSDPSVLEVTADQENLLKAVARGRAVGVATISCEVDADLDEGETRSLFANIEIEVVATEAVLVNIIAEDIEDQPPPIGDPV